MGEVKLSGKKFEVLPASSSKRLSALERKKFEMPCGALDCGV
jgi:hypothetical protein